MQQIARKAAPGWKTKTNPKKNTIPLIFHVAAQRNPVCDEHSNTLYVLTAKMSRKRVESMVVTTKFYPKTSANRQHQSKKLASRQKSSPIGSPAFNSTDSPATVRRTPSLLDTRIPMLALVVQVSSVCFLFSFSTIKRDSPKGLDWISLVCCCWSPTNSQPQNGDESDVVLIPTKTAENSGYAYICKAIPRICNLRQLLTDLRWVLAARSSFGPLEKRHRLLQGAARNSFGHTRVYQLLGNSQAFSWQDGRGEDAADVKHGTRLGTFAFAHVESQLLLFLHRVHGSHLERAQMWWSVSSNPLWLHSFVKAIGVHIALRNANLLELAHQKLDHHHVSVHLRVQN